MSLYRGSLYLSGMCKTSVRLGFCTTTSSLLSQTLSVAAAYSYIHCPVFSAHGSFLLSNAAVEYEVIWGWTTEDFQFAVRARLNKLSDKCDEH
jgi:hypothetical protein